VTVGALVGGHRYVGPWVVGVKVGKDVGTMDGVSVGKVDGSLLGLKVGCSVAVGASVGE
jgi:hypothetical protein